MLSFQILFRNGWIVNKKSSAISSGGAWGAGAGCPTHPLLLPGAESKSSCPSSAGLAFPSCSLAGNCCHSLNFSVAWETERYFSLEMGISVPLASSLRRLWNGPEASAGLQAGWLVPALSCAGLGQGASDCWGGHCLPGGVTPTEFEVIFNRAKKNFVKLLLCFYGSKQLLCR